MAGDSIWLDVLPSLKGFGQALVSGTKKAGSDAGKSTGSAWSQAFKTAAGDGGAKAATDALIEQETRAKKAVKDAVREISQARSQQKEASARVVLAEEKLSDTVAKYGPDSAQAEAATLRLEAAREKQAGATYRAEAAEIQIREASNAAKVASEQLADAQGELNDETGKAPSLWARAKESMKSATEEGGRAEKVWGFVKDGFKNAGKAVGVGIAAVGAGIVAIGAKGIHGGLQRAMNIEDAQASLRGLGHDVDSIGQIMDNAMASVKGTSFGLGDAATIASTAVAAGIKPGEELERTLRLTANTAALARTGLDDMGSILNKVWTNGKVSTQELNQIADRGIPIWTNLAEHYGVSGSELQKMVSSGKVSATEFADVLENTVGNAAEEMGNTTRGAWANMMAALSRGGEKFLSNVFPMFKDGFTGLTELLDEIGPIVEEAGKTVGKWINDNVVPALKAAGKWVKESLIPAIQNLIGWVRDDLAPILEKVFKSIGTFIKEDALPALQSVGAFITDEAIPALKDLGGWLKDNKDWLLAIAVGVGSVAAAWGLWQVALTAWEIATKIGTGVQAAFNAVMNANPIMLVVTAVGALVAGLVYFFTQTETGKEIWAKFTGFLSDAWDSVTGALTVAWEAVQTGLKAGWDFIYAYIITPYVEYWKFVGSIFNAVKDGIVKAWDLMKTGLKIGWDWIKDKVFEPIKSGAQWVGDKFVLLKDNALAAWDRMKSNLKAGWDWISDKVFGPMKTGVEAIGTVFDKTKDFIGTAWDKIKAVAAKPVNFIIETVYTKGIKNVWDKIAGKIGLKLDLPTVPAIKMATGGVLPGYTPGKDVHHFDSPTAGRLSLSGGEAIMRPEFTRAMGGEAGIHRLNALARAGQLESQAFAGGGVWDRVKSGAKGAWNWTKGAAGATWDWTKNTAESVANFVSDPISAIAELIGKPVNDFLKTMAPGFVGDVLKQVPGKFLDGFGTWAKEKLFGRETEGGGGSGGPATPGMGWRAQSNIIKSMFPTARITSGFRPGAITATGIPSMHGKGRAVDIAPPSMAMFNRLLAAYPNSQQILYSPAGARQIVWNGRRGSTSGITKQMHYNHVHWAMANGGVLPNDLNFGTYDTGGVLPPGDTLVSNKTGKPELILNAQQIAQLSHPSEPLDLSDNTIDDLSKSIASKLGPMSRSTKEVNDAIDDSRILERME
ncbi:tape measure protein [Jonesiaceae bacterium BS-20]|uniref:Tape measure protein n=1 Tax=Jonesiaceae bacterium BS-20 TaxID=3120821 RepID=A0AAU7DWF7_9MICO